MNTELDEVSEFKPDFHVKLPSDREPPPPQKAKSLIEEVEKLSERVNTLCITLRGLCTLMGTLDRKIETARQAEHREVNNHG